MNEIQIRAHFARKPYNIDDVRAQIESRREVPEHIEIEARHELTTQAYDAFCHEPLKDREWLRGKGGWRDGVRQVVEVTAPGRDTLYIDPSGSAYGRYIGMAAA